MQRLRVLQKKYYNELGGKSPFFRAWFGDWRSNDNTPVHIVTEKGSVRGTTKNKDTGWDIQVSGKVFNETKSHDSSKAKTAISYLDYINGLVENAVLLDSYTVPSKKAKSENSVMMHSMYALCDNDNGIDLIKMYVEEMRDPNTNGTDKRSYQLQNIAKQQLSAKGSGKSLAQSFSAADSYTISYLFKIVKQFDKNFNPEPSSKVVNEDGTPKVVYHGTSRGGFTEFDTYFYLSKYGLFGNGAYFTESHSIADAYTHKGKGKNPQIYEAYLNIKNPIDMDAAADVNLWNKVLKNADYNEWAVYGDTNEQVFRKIEQELEDNYIPKYEGKELRPSFLLAQQISAWAKLQEA